MSDFSAPVLTDTRRATFAPSVSSEEIEARAGIAPLEELLSERFDLVQRIAELRAVYGPFGTWDHLRKNELSRIKSLIRLQAMRDNRKVNNDVVDEEAHEHPDYTAFVVKATKDRAEYFKLEAEVEAIDFRINRGQGLLRYATYEPRN